MKHAAVVRSVSSDNPGDGAKDILPVDPPQQPLQSSLPKRYSNTKLLLGLLGSTLSFGLTAGFVLTGAARATEALALRLANNDYLVLLLFAAMFGSAQMVILFPLRLYSGYYLEHRYGLSTQSMRAWLWEGTKAFVVGLPISILILLAFYRCLRQFGSLWWLPVASLLFVVGVILARIAPVVILPLFYKFKPLEEGTLRHRILGLCDRQGVPVGGVFVFDLSKSTKKANAAFTGMGRSRRIILGDTLVSNFSDDEVEVVFAHELGHRKLGHIWSLIVVGTVSSFAGLYITSRLYAASLGWFGYSSQNEIAALPLLGLWLAVYSIVSSPIQNAFSRAHERSADRFALRATGMKEAFISAMRKLALLNLADRTPHPLVEFLFYSHPSIEKRIAAALRTEV